MSRTAQLSRALFKTRTIRDRIVDTAWVVNLSVFSQRSLQGFKVDVIEFVFY